MESRVAFLGIALVLGGALLALLLPSGPPPAGAGRPRDVPWGVSYERTDVALDTYASLSPERNLVWCATLSLAWGELAATLGEGGRLDLGGKPEALAAAEALNDHPFPKRDLDEGSYVALGGLVRDGILARIDAAWRERFPEAGPPPPISAGDLDAVAFAALRKDLPFEQPFRLHPGLTPFGDTGVGVRTFGMLHDDYGPDVEEMAKQVAAYGEDHGGGTVVELTPKGGGDRILLSSLRPERTLEGTWLAAARRMAAVPRDVLEPSTELVVPRLRMDLERHFRELEGAEIPRIPGAFLKEARQRVEFSLSERGAILRSEAVMVATLGISRPLRFDRPFLLALMREGATRPYFLIWVGNEDLLDRSVPEPAPAHVIRPLTGAWVLDPDASIAEERARSSSAVENFGRSLGESIERTFRGLEMEGEVVGDGVAWFRHRERPSRGGEERPWRTTRGRVMTLQGRPVFVPEGAPLPRDPLEGEDLGHDPFAPWPIEVAGRKIRVRVPDVWVVLRRR